jgi:hypothetical protein
MIEQNVGAAVRVDERRRVGVLDDQSHERHRVSLLIMIKNETSVRKTAAGSFIFVNLGLSLGAEKG